MRSMAVNEIHDVLLEVLKHLHKFCSQKNIKYGLAYGTMLGAIRHKGFIPWDDDADVFMPRPDYNRFLKEFIDSDEFKLYAPERNNSGIPYARICEMKRTWFGQNLLWTLERPGVGVDIFPYDAVPEDDSKFKECVNADASFYWKVEAARALVRAVPRNWGLCVDQSIIRKVKNVRRLLLNFSSARSAEEIMISSANGFSDFVQADEFESSHVCGIRLIPTYACKERIPRQWIVNFQEVDFCDTHLCVPVEYDKILKNYYNDYMRIPDESERITHSACQTMKWRE